MSHFDKRQTVMTELILNADRSNREVARNLGFSEGLVRSVRKALEKSAIIPVKEREKGGRRPKEGPKKSERQIPMKEIEPIEFIPSELVTPFAGEDDRERLEHQVLDL